jgi:hypothetical protein
VFLNVVRIIGIIYYNTLKYLSWTTARVAQFDGAAEVIVNVPRGRKIGPDQYFYLLTPAVGFWSFCQRHPYSIAWWSEDEKGRAVTILLLVKV